MIMTYITSHLWHNRSNRLHYVWMSCYCMGASAKSKNAICPHWPSVLL